MATFEKILFIVINRIRTQASKDFYSKITDSSKIRFSQEIF